MPAAPSPATGLAAWLQLGLTPGIGPLTARALLEHFGSPEAALAAPSPALEARIGPKRAHALRVPDDDVLRQVAQALKWAEQTDHHLISLADPRYPRLLAEVKDAPPLLYAVGKPSLLQRPILALVGSRNPTAGGLSLAEHFAHALCAAGWTIASGLALGIDAAAHRGALAGPGGTIAVVGTGADVLYPARNRALAERIQAEGLLISELPLGTPPAAGQFPRRNRLIAGLSRGVLVVEAALHSGSLITAREAAEYGREVLAIPGSIHSPLARGCHALIRDGAVLVECVEDVQAALPLAGSHPASLGTMAQALAEPSPSAAQDIDPVLAAIGYSPVLPDELGLHLGWEAGELGARLVLLELEGSIERLSDGRVVRCALRA